LLDSYLVSIVALEIFSNGEALMSDTLRDGAVCGVDGCSIEPIPDTSHKNVRGTLGPAHDLVIVSDVICPWCFVAKKNLDLALERVGPEFLVKITWRPFELNPDMRKEGMNRREYRSSKFGSWAYSQALDVQVSDAGKRADIAFRYDLIDRTPNTFDAHRLIWRAGEEGFQDAVVDGLFLAYFTEGRDVGSPRVLVEIARDAGMDEKRTAFLVGGEGVDEVRLAEQAARTDGISSVPTFILDGQRLFSGALTPDIMAAQLRLAATAHAER
jgi:predicted DsbA family dithiol-disulfide isomerase